MTKLFEFPTTSKEALEKGHTYFVSHRTCPIHNTRFHWAGNGGCMACFDIDGNKYMMRTPYRALPHSTTRTYKENKHAERNS